MLVDQKGGGHQTDRVADRDFRPELMDKDWVDREILLRKKDIPGYERASWALMGHRSPLWDYNHPGSLWEDEKLTTGIILIPSCEDSK
jgi:hypothetical protein